MDEMDWALVKVKGDMTSSVTGPKGEKVTKYTTLRRNLQVRCKRTHVWVVVINGVFIYIENLE